MKQKPETKPQERKVSELALALKISRIQVWRLVQKGMPLDENGAREWRAQNVRTKTGKQFDQTTRLRAAQADLAEIEAAEKRAELAPVEDMQIAWNEAFVILRSETEAIAGRCAAQLSAMSDQAEIRPLLLNEIRRALTSAADRIEAWARSIASGASAATAADPTTGPVGRPN